MRLYIDDDSIDPHLIRLLRREGHDVQIPADVGLAGGSDQVHLARAIRNLEKAGVPIADSYHKLNHWQ